MTSGLASFSSLSLIEYWPKFSSNIFHQTTFEEAEAFADWFVHLDGIETYYFGMASAGKLHCKNVNTYKHYGDTEKMDFNHHIWLQHNRADERCRLSTHRLRNYVMIFQTKDPNEQKKLHKAIIGKRLKDSRCKTEIHSGAKVEDFRIGYVYIAYATRGNKDIRDTLKEKMIEIVGSITNLSVDQSTSASQHAQSSLEQLRLEANQKIAKASVSDLEAILKILS